MRAGRAWIDAVALALGLLALVILKELDDMGTRKQDAEELTEAIETLQAAFEEGVRDTRAALEAIRTALEHTAEAPEARIDAARKLLGELLKKMPRIAQSDGD